jgi:lipopolysaccharide export system permease protein
MSRLDRYFLLSLTRVTIFSGVFSLVLLLSLQALRLSDLIIKSGLDGLSIIKMLGGLSLSFTPLIFPISFLFSLLTVFGRMSSDREMVAMQAMGHSPKRLLRPCMQFGALVSLFTILCGFFLAPLGNRAFEAVIDEAFNKKVTSVIRAGTFAEGFLNMVLFVDEVDPSGLLHRVFLHDEKSFANEVTISSKTGEWIPAGKDGWAQLRLKNGVLISKKEDQQSVRRILFDEYVINADFSQEAGRSRDSPPSLSLAGLIKHRRSELDNPEGDPRNIYVEMARRLAIAFVCFLFVPLTFSLSVNNQRTAKNRTVAYGISILILYWTFYFSIVTWAIKTHLPMARSELFCWLVVWIPNILIAFAARYFYLWRFSPEKNWKRSHEIQKS